MTVLTRFVENARRSLKVSLVQTPPFSFVKKHLLRPASPCTINLDEVIP